jgi:plastocyanin
MSSPPVTSRLRLLAFGAGLLLLSSCGGTVTPRTGSTPSAATSSATVSIAPSPSKGPALEPLVVHIRNFAYVPAAPVVLVGQPIEIINDDVAAHTWSAAPKAGWAYTSGNLEKGQRATFPGFSTPGRYKFLCYYHAEMPSMNGVVTVKAAP